MLSNPFKVETITRPTSLQMVCGRKRYEKRVFIDETVTTDTVLSVILKVGSLEWQEWTGEFLRNPDFRSVEVVDEKS